MAAPAQTGTGTGAANSNRYLASFSNLTTWAITITGGYAATDAVTVAAMQSNSTIRTLNSIVDTPGNTYSNYVTQAVANGQSGAVHLWDSLTGRVALAGGDTITATFSAGASGLLLTQAWTPMTRATLSDVSAETSTATSHVMGATGLNPANGDVLLVGGAAAGSAFTTPVAGTNWTALINSGIGFVQYRQSDPAIGGLDQGAWSHSPAARAAKGAMVAYYAVATVFPECLVQQPDPVRAIGVVGY